MASIRQLIERKKRRKRFRLLALAGSPFRKGVIIRVIIVTPKKPNSALRKVCRVALTSSKKTSCQIHGEGHNLQRHSTILVRGCRVRDIPGVKFRAIRGVYDFSGLARRRTSRSKYGTKSPHVTDRQRRAIWRAQQFEISEISRLKRRKLNLDVLKRRQEALKKEAMA